MGHAQFMPSTYRKYAMDGDADGHRNIWTDELDAIASIARYLAAEGWQTGQNWGYEVTLTKPVSDTETGLDVALDLASWQRHGIKGKANVLPQGDFSASLIRPDGAGGRSFLVYDNFRALMRWNRSTYFATSVGLLADHISNGS
jgi:membrane-bound lytic murein transglycosylase B